jgi:hypothetical protein
MANFAELDENNIVVKIHHCSNDTLIDENGECCDDIGHERCCLVCGHNRIVQASINNNIRGRFPRVGDYYNQELDIFHGEQPYKDWILNTETALWEEPIPKPEITDENVHHYEWNQEIYEDTGDGWIPVPKISKDQYVKGAYVEYNNESKQYEIIDKPRIISIGIDEELEIIDIINNPVNDILIQNIESVCGIGSTELTIESFIDCICNNPWVDPNLLKTYEDDYEFYLNS